ncbi:MAG: hypothetical protein AAF628_15425 [Planctomycetota bacterium]
MIDAEVGRAPASGVGCARLHEHHRATAFGLGLRHAEPLAPAWLVLGTAATPLGCGACSLVPAPLTVLPFSTDQHGDALLATSLADPVLRGQTLLAQWLVAGPGGCAAVGLSFSGALEVQFQ